MTRRKEPEERKPGRKPQKERSDKGAVRGPRDQLGTPCLKCGGRGDAHYLTCPTLHLPTKKGEGE